MSKVALKPWEQEVLARHRWGQHGDQAKRELAKLKTLWDRIQPVDNNTTKILDGIIDLEICNWNLETSILSLCKAIGEKGSADMPIGHMASVSDERWRKVWAYYLSLRKWLRHEGPSGYSSLLRVVDPDHEIQKHVESLLGGRSDLKELYVERFCVCLEAFLDGSVGGMASSPKPCSTVVSALEDQIKKYDSDSQLLKAMNYKIWGGGLFPCSHKAFRRYDIIISSIGCGRWRGAISVRGTDGFERAAVLETYLAPIEMWLTGAEQKTNGNGLTENILSLLGQKDETKIFLASLLLSLLRAQQLAAKKRAESRAERSDHSSESVT